MTIHITIELQMDLDVDLRDHNHPDTAVNVVADDLVERVADAVVNVMGMDLKARLTFKGWS